MRGQVPRDGCEDRIATLKSSCRKRAAPMGRTNPDDGVRIMGSVQLCPISVVELPPKLPWHLSPPCRASRPGLFDSSPSGTAATLFLNRPFFLQLRRR